MRSTLPDLPHTTRSGIAPGDLRSGEEFTNEPLPLSPFWLRHRITPIKILAALRLVTLGHKRAAVARVVGISAPSVAKIANAPQAEREALLALNGNTHWLAMVAELVGSALFWSAPKQCWIVRFPVMAVVDGRVQFAVCSKCPACGHGIADTRDRRECRCCGTPFKSVPPDPVNRYLRTDRPTKVDVDLIIEVIGALRRFTQEGVTDVVGVRKGQLLFLHEKWRRDGEVSLDDHLERMRRQQATNARQLRDRRRKMAKRSRRKNRQRS